MGEGRQREDSGGSAHHPLESSLHLVASRRTICRGGTRPRFDSLWRGELSTALSGMQPLGNRKIPRSYSGLRISRDAGSPSYQQGAEGASLRISSRFFLFFFASRCEIFGVHGSEGIGSSALLFLASLARVEPNEVSRRKPRQDSKYDAQGSLRIDAIVFFVGDRYGKIRTFLTVHCDLHLRIL